MTTLNPAVNFKICEGKNIFVHQSTYPMDRINWNETAEQRCVVAGWHSSLVACPSPLDETLEPGRTPTRISETHRTLRLVGWFAPLAGSQSRCERHIASVVRSLLRLDRFSQSDSVANKKKPGNKPVGGIRIQKKLHFRLEAPATIEFQVVSV